MSPGVKVLAVPYQYGAIQRKGGLNIPALQQHVAITGSVVAVGQIPLHSMSPDTSAGRVCLFLHP